jgi:TolB protein
MKSYGMPQVSRLSILLYLCIWISSQSLWAQKTDKKTDTPTPDGIPVLVNPGEVKRVVIAVPSAFNLGESKDNIGVGIRVVKALQKGLLMSGYFDLLEPELYPQDPQTEGMTPQYIGWYNSGTQGLIKAGFSLVGDQIQLTLKLFDIDRKIPVNLKGDVDDQVLIDRKPETIRRRVFDFVNQVIAFYTGKPGFLGSRIVAVRKTSRGKSIVLLSTDGQNVNTVTKTGKINLLPTLSSQGIYFTSYRNGGPHLFRYKSGSVTKVSARKGINMNASLSPNGAFLAAVLSHQGSSEIYLLDPQNGKVLRRLTRNKSIDVAPTWSPDGKRIAFVSDRQGSPQIWVMNADGNHQRRITFEGEYNQTPTWSPQGDVIAFTARDESLVFDILTVDPQTSELKRLTQNQGNNEVPSFSPDGRHITFSSTRTGKSEIYIMTADGFTQRQLTKGGGYMTPHWGK